MVSKSKTGIAGLDELLDGGFPEGRPTLLCGNAGSGKTLLSLAFIYNGITQFDEPGAFISFEENATELEENVSSFGWDLKKLEEEGKISFDFFGQEIDHFFESGEYNLDGLFLRLELALDSVKAKRLVIDSIETLFSNFQDDSILRRELHRLFRWIKEKGITLILTGEAGTNTITKHGIEEYVADCVIQLSSRFEKNMLKRKLRVIKYRGSRHGEYDYPYLITNSGFFILPITELDLDYKVSDERISTGNSELDDMLGGDGFYRGCSLLLSGMAGTGKSNLSATIAMASCLRGEKVVYLSLEESPHQLMRNFATIGMDFAPYEKEGLITFNSWRTPRHGLESHLLRTIQLVEEIKPSIVIFDPISNLIDVASEIEAKNMFIRIGDFLKRKMITGVFVNLVRDYNLIDNTDLAISSIMDTWIMLRELDSGAERTRHVYVVKSRGSANSNQLREMLITEEGLEILPVCVDESGKLKYGSERIAYIGGDNIRRKLKQEKIKNLQETIDLKEKEFEVKRTQLEIEHKKILKEARKELELLKTESEHTEDSVKTIEEFASKTDKNLEMIEELEE